MGPGDSHAEPCFCSGSRPTPGREITETDSATDPKSSHEGEFSNQRVAGLEGRAAEMLTDLAVVS